MAKSSNLREIREGKGLTRGDIAKALSVTVEEVMSWESGKTEPSTHHIMGLARALEMSPGELMSGLNSPFKSSSMGTQSSGMIMVSNVGYIFIALGFYQYIGLYTALPEIYSLVVLFIGLSCVLLSLLNYQREASFSKGLLMWHLLYVVAVVGLPYLLMVLPIEHGLRGVVCTLVTLVIVAVLNFRYWQKAWRKK